MFTHTHTKKHLFSHLPLGKTKATQTVFVFLDIYHLRDFLLHSNIMEVNRISVVVLKASNNDIVPVTLDKRAVPIKNVCREACGVF